MSFNKPFRVLPLKHIELTKFKVNATHEQAAWADTVTFIDAFSADNIPVIFSDSIAFIDTFSVPGVDYPFPAGAMFRSPKRFMAFVSPKRNLSIVSLERRLSFTSPERKLAFKSILKQDAY